MAALLLVIDKQEWHVGPSSPLLRQWGPGQVARAIARADQVIAAARAGGIPVWWTQNEEGHVPVQWPLDTSDVLTVADPRYAVYGLQPEPSETVIAKRFPGALLADDPAWTEPDLADADMVYLVGAYAGRCVLATATNLVARGKKVTVVADAVAAHPGAPHELETTLFTVRTTLGWVVSAAEAIIDFTDQHPKTA